MRALVIGCGNLLRGDDAAGPTLARRLRDRGLPAGVDCRDGGTGGIDVALWMRGVPRVILVDACRSGAEPGSVFELAGAEVEALPPIGSVSLHAFRWDHALAFARWHLGDDYPAKVTVWLVEGGDFEPGAPLSPAVDRALDVIAGKILTELGDRSPHPGMPGDPSPPAESGPGRPAADAAAAGWVAGPLEREVTDGSLLACGDGETAAIVVRSAEGLRAYRARCPHAGLPLAGARVDPDGATLTCRWHAHRFDTESGACRSSPRCRLERWPLRVVDGVVWYRPR